MSRIVSHAFSFSLFSPDECDLKSYPTFFFLFFVFPIHICSFILAAIVYVLARAGTNDCKETPAQAAMSSLQASMNAPSSGSSVSAQSSSAASSIKASTVSSSSKDVDFSNFDIGAYREKILSQSTPYIIECKEAGVGGSQEACHLPRDKRYAALEQKGVTLWMTGLSGSGKSTIAALLEEQLVLQHGKSVYRLDGDQHTLSTLQHSHMHK